MHAAVTHKAFDCSSYWCYADRSDFSDLANCRTHTHTHTHTRIFTCTGGGPVRLSTAGKNCHTHTHTAINCRYTHTRTHTHTYTRTRTRVYACTGGGPVRPSTAGTFCKTDGSDTSALGAAPGPNNHVPNFGGGVQLIDSSEITLQKQIGSGAYGKVCALMCVCVCVCVHACVCLCFDRRA